MSPSFRIDEAYLVGGWCAAALWGIFSCFIAFALFQVYLLHRRGEFTRSTTVTITAVLVLYGLSTAHISLGLRRLIVGLIGIQGPGTIPYFADIELPLNQAKDLIYVTSMVIADSVVVWRCWVIWNGNLYALGFPILLILCTAVAAYGSIAQTFIVNPNPDVAGAFGVSLFAVSLATNLVVTALTIGRIWWASRSLASTESGRQTYLNIIIMLFETGAVITIAKALEFIFFNLAPTDGINGFNALYIIFDMIPHINGIVPTSIIIMVNWLRNGENMTGSNRRPTQGSSRQAVGPILFAAGRSQTSSIPLSSPLRGRSESTEVTALTAKSLKSRQLAYSEDEEAFLQDV